MGRKKRQSQTSAQESLPGMWPQYLSPVEAELSLKYQFRGEIRSGKTGVTYKLSDHLGLNDYCLKTIKESVSSQDERQRVKETLTKEVKILAPLGHRCLPSIYDRNVEGDLPYYVCTYHPGLTFADFRKANRALTREQAIHVITSLLDALEYLHAHGRTHCDFHDNNILISDNVFAEGILVIDFGSGHRESDSKDETPDRGHFAFKDVTRLPQYRERINRHDADSEFRRNDIRALGTALALMTDCFFGTAPRDQYLAYQEFCAVLQSGRVGDWETVKKRFEFVMDPRALYSRTDRLFIRKSGMRESITLPVSQGVPVGEAVLSVVNTKVFQRLRYTKQLSFCDWFYPGGTHTRFEHSLGVFEVTLKAIGCLVHDAYFKDQFGHENIDGALLAALIHDVGHYPYAHVLEQYVGSRFHGPGHEELRRAVHHSDNTLAIIDDDEELRAAALTWSHSGGILTEAKKVLTGEMGVLSHLLDGPIDCDKLDYLRRDSHHCGVRYGEGLDVGRILRSYCCVDGGDELGILSSGVSAVEGFMVVQDQMLNTVYWHERIRGVIAMFHRFLDGVFGEDTDRLKAFVMKLKSCISEQEALHSAIFPLLDGLPHSKPKAGTKGSRQELLPLVQLHKKPSFRDIYLPVATYTILDDAPAKRKQLGSIYRLIVHEMTQSRDSVPIQWHAVRALRGFFKQAFEERQNGQTVGRFDVVVDLPWGKTAGKMVKVRGDDGRSDYRITEVSHLKDTIFSELAAFTAPVRVFVSPQLYAKHEYHLGAIKQTAESMFFEKESPQDDE